MPLTTNPAIEEAVAQLDQDGLRVSLHADGDYAVLILDEYSVPAGWSKSRIRLLLKLPLSFPNGNPDMFWTDQDLRLADGREPEQAQLIEAILERSWRRFSWHPSTWVPGRDDIRTYLAFVDRRLTQLK